MKRDLRPRPCQALAHEAGKVTLLLTLGLAFSVSAGEAQHDVFLRGNELYLEEDYGGAVEAYEAVLASGFQSGELHYNLGNAHFKAGNLGLSILSWERALKLDAGNADALANLALASTLTVDEVEPLPRFWLLSTVSWWMNLAPRSALIVLTATGWLALAAGMVVRTLALEEHRQRAGLWTALVGLSVVLALGPSLIVRESGLGQAERGVVLTESVPVRSAPVEDDNLTLFEVHEGTRVRIDHRTEGWAEVVLDDGKVGWVPMGSMGVI
jgi:hypothetical protein